MNVTTLITNKQEMTRPQALKKLVLVSIFSIGMISTYAIPTINAEANFTSQQELQNCVEVNESELPQPVIDAVAK